MSRRVGFSLLLCAVIVACCVSVSCTGVPTTFHAVQLTPKGPIVVASGSATPVSALVMNDSSGAGVTWTPPAHGTLAAVTTTSATYNAPTLAPGASVQDAVKATSVTYTNQFSTLLITVTGAPLISTNVLPDGNQGSPYAQVVNATGGVAPFTWLVSVGTLPPGLSLAPSITNSVTITGTPTTQGISNFTIKATDSTGAFGTQALSISIGAPLPLNVTTTVLPNGTLNSAYPATTLQASGGVPPFTWTLAPLSSPLPNGLSLATDGTITGIPTAIGTFNFTVQVTDSETPAITKTANLSITIENLGALNGNFAFEFSGFNSTGGVVVAGSFTADGSGGISNGVQNTNTETGSPASQTFTGTYTLGADNRGVLTLSVTGVGVPNKYAFSIDGSGLHGRLIAFDSSGAHGSGQFEQRTVSTCASDTINSNWAFGVSGQEGAFGGTPAGPAVIVGSFLASPPGGGSTQGSIGPGEDDYNTPGTVSFSAPDQTLSGTFQATSPASTRCTMTLSPSIGTMNFSVYPVSSTEAYMVETDQVNSTTTPFITVGEIFQQVGAPFAGTAGSTLTGTSVAGLTGQFLTGGVYKDDLALVSLTGTGTTSYTISILENQGGNIGVFAPATPNFSSFDQYGRLDSGIASPLAPVFYMIGPNQAFCIGEILGDPFFGLFDPQSTGPFTASGTNGTYILGTSAPATTLDQNLSGTITLANTSTTAGTINGTVDQNALGGNTPSLAFTSTYSGLNSATGAGTFTLTSPGALTGSLLIESPTTILMMSTVPGAANPNLIILGN